MGINIANVDFVSTMQKTESLAQFFNQKRLLLHFNEVWKIEIY